MLQTTNVLCEIYLSADDDTPFEKILKEFQISRELKLTEVVHLVHLST